MSKCQQKRFFGRTYPHAANDRLVLGVAYSATANCFRAIVSRLAATTDEST
jgi:hypothetical protein